MKKRSNQVMFEHINRYYIDFKVHTEEQKTQMKCLGVLFSADCQVEDILAEKVYMRLLTVYSWLIPGETVMDSIKKVHMCREMMKLPHMNVFKFHVIRIVG